MNQSNKVVVYSLPNCMQCTATYKRFEKNNIDYDVVDMSQDPNAREIVKSLGHRQAPVIVVSDETGSVVSHWSGLRIDLINSLQTNSGENN